MKPKWLDRSIVYGVYYTLCTTREMFEREVKRMTGYPPASKDPNYWCMPGMACVHTLEQKNSPMPACVVCIDAAAHAERPIAAVSKLVHEATHIKQRIMEVIGEDSPSKEFEAYTMQNLTDELLAEYKRQVFGE
jgi:hypothetical protein